jgi:CBS domain-containing protein
MKIRDIMRPPVWIDSIDSLGAAYELMRGHQLPHLPVVREGKVVGILCERDLLEYRAALGFGEPWRDCGVSGAMTRNPGTVGPDDRVADAAARLASARIAALPVVSRGALVGIVTIGDVLAAEVRTPPRRLTTAADVMTPGPFTTCADESLLDAARRMAVHGIRHLPVVDEEERVTGILSERDLRSAVGDLARFTQAGTPAALRVRDAMTAPAVSIGTDRVLDDVVRLFEDGRIGAVPVVDADARLVGIVSYVDALRALAAASPRP